MKITVIEAGRLGGSVTSAKKRRAARANGRKGGRPKKTVCPACGGDHPTGCCAQDGHGG